MRRSSRAAADFRTALKDRRFVYIFEALVNIYKQVYNLSRTASIIRRLRPIDRNTPFLPFAVFWPQVFLLTCKTSNDRGADARSLGRAGRPAATPRGGRSAEFAGILSLGDGGWACGRYPPDCLPAKLTKVIDFREFVSSCAILTGQSSVHSAGTLFFAPAEITLFAGASFMNLRLSARSAERAAGQVACS